jgi:hypothetical protein
MIIAMIKIVETARTVLIGMIFPLAVLVTWNFMLKHDK